MRTSLVLLSLLIASIFSSFAQEQTIQLKLKEGYEYVFEKVDKNYSIKENGTKVQNSESKLGFRLEIEKTIPDSAIIINLNYNESLNEQKYKEQLINKTDIFFPDFNESSSGHVYRSNYVDPVLSSLTFNYLIHLKTGEITYENRADVLEEAYSRLKEKRYSDKRIESAIQSINERKLNYQSETIEFLTWFLNEKVSVGDKIASGKLGEIFPVNKQQGNLIFCGERDFNKVKAGQTGKKFSIDTENGLITNYAIYKVDSVKSRTESVLEGNVIRINESNFRLVYSQKVPAKKLVISGKIENPLSDNIHIRYLNDPFGSTLKTKTILLNTDNSFKTVIDFPHSGFVYLENENKNKHNPPGTYVLYSEPGDTISFNSTGLELPWETTFSGSNSKTSELLYKIRSDIKLPEEVMRKSSTNLVFDQMRLFGITVIRMGDDSNTERSSFIPKIFNLLEESKLIIKPYKSIISERAFDFISNETKAYFYNALYENALLETRRYGIRGNDVIISQQEFSDELSKIDLINVHKIYNDYGLHSRMCVQSYINYNFAEASKISQGIASLFGRSNPYELDLKTQFSRMVLTGAPLYRELGRTYQDVVLNDSKHPGTDRQIPQQKAIEGLELMVQLCNDPEIIREAKQIIRQYSRLQDEHYLPPLEMLDVGGSTVTYEDLIKGKPTIFCFSSNWIGKRYELDQQAIKSTDLRFVFVVEGTSLKQWQQYTERAVPDAEQLLFISEEQSINDVFQDDEVYLIFDNEGKFIEYGDGIKSSISVAKESLQPKKKALDKSQLQIIIILLAISLVALFIGFILWKWRIRQRFRKEEQFRKLRELELTAIRSQMNPHFLFNSLNSVQNLVQQNMGREAHLYLSDFAGLIRKVLRNSEKEEVSLAEELEMTEQYLNLEKLRFDFNFEINVRNGIDQHNTMVPSMLLQPLVENSVVHGLQNKPEDRRLKIDVLKEHSTRLAVPNRLAQAGIKITIEDNGIGREAAKQIAKDKNGKGTKLVKERLEVLQQKQGEKYQMEIIDLNGENIGTRVEILIPEEN